MKFRAEGLILSIIILIGSMVYVANHAGGELLLVARIVMGAVAFGAVILVILLLGWVVMRLRVYNHQVTASLADAQVTTVVVNENENLFIRESNPTAVWHNTNLEPRAVIGSSLACPTKDESERWFYFQKFKFVSRMKFGGGPKNNMLEPNEGIEAPLSLPSQQTPPPDYVDLMELKKNRPYSVNDLILGVSHNGLLVSTGLKRLTHIAIAGSTRYGKSIFIQSLLYQMAMAKEDVLFYLADMGGNTFVDFGIPFADSIPDTDLMVHQVMAEAERRKDLYMATGRGIKSLDMYNAITGKNLPWAVMIIDEALFLMEKSKAIKSNIELAVSWAAKYGITCIVVSQDFKANVISTATRNNFSSRFQFLAEDQTQASILIKGSEAHNIEVEGRCFSRLPGNRSIIELQTPFIAEEKIMEIAPAIQQMNGFDPNTKLAEIKKRYGFVHEPEKPVAIAKYHPDNVNGAIDTLLTENSNIFPTKGEVSQKVGIKGGSKYGLVMDTYNERFKAWQKTLLPASQGSEKG